MRGAEVAGSHRRPAFFLSLRFSSDLATRAIPVGRQHRPPLSSLGVPPTISARRASSGVPSNHWAALKRDGYRWCSAPPRAAAPSTYFGSIIFRAFAAAMAYPIPAGRADSGVGRWIPAPLPLLWRPRSANWELCLPFIAEISG